MTEKERIAWGRHLEREYGIEIEQIAAKAAREDGDGLVRGAEVAGEVWIALLKCRDLAQTAAKGERAYILGTAHEEAHRAVREEVGEIRDAGGARCLQNSFPESWKLPSAAVSYIVRGEKYTPDKVREMLLSYEDLVEYIDAGGSSDGYWEDVEDVKYREGAPRARPPTPDGHAVFGLVEHRIALDKAIDRLHEPQRGYMRELTRGRGRRKIEDIALAVGLPRATFDYQVCACAKKIADMLRVQPTQLTRGEELSKALPPDTLKGHSPR